MTTGRITSKTRVGSGNETIHFRTHRAQLPISNSDISVALSEINRTSGKNSKDTELLLSFRGGTVSSVQESVIEYLIEEAPCTDAVILNMISKDEFTVFTCNEAVQKVTYWMKMFNGISNTLVKSHPTLLEENIESWKQIFLFVPSFLILIPVKIVSELGKSKMGNIETITVLAFKGNLPESLTSETSWHILIASCRLTAPLLVNAQRCEDNLKKLNRMAHAIEGIRNVEKEIQDISSCINSIGLELQPIFAATHSVVFVLQDDPFDPLLLKYGSFGGGKIDKECPNKECHTKEELLQSTKFPAGWVALHRKCLRINQPYELEKFCGVKGPLHSIGGCIVKNMMCFAIEDHSTDMPLVVELADKVGGFTDTDEAEAILFAKLASYVLSSAVMLDYRNRAIRRSDITNELLNNIKTVQFTKVKHLLDMKFQYSTSFQRKFFTTKFVFKQLSVEQYPGVILYMFTELGFIIRWKIRRATLIRFILSIHQGYRDNPYHNWKHACTVTHFAFILLSKMELTRKGFLTDIEALALMVACLCHDIDHRGMNNHFSLSLDADPFHIYKQEEGLLERHHVAVALQVLSSDECNIVENLTDSEYGEFIELVQWNILATDIGKYLHDRTSLFAVMKKFDKKKKENRRVLMRLVMTMCDLCETVKPWNDYIITVKNIFSEFFIQGDEELRLGYNPTPIMDRRIAYIPYIEMKFINEIVRPVYEVIAKLIPKTDHCVHTIDYFKELWLVATNVFDENVHMGNPLDILKLQGMREVNLQKSRAPELEKHVINIRHSIRMSLRANSLRKTSSQAVLRLSAEDISPELLTQQPLAEQKTCKSIILNTLCCMQCRRKALFHASYVRRNHHETEFMEQRSEEYEKRRSAEIHNLDSAHVRERIHSLINPNPF